MNTALLAARYFCADLFGGILYFPLWWYTKGLKGALVWLGRSIETGNEMMGWSVWVRNVFVPMYGETGFVGRAISLFMRLAMIILRGIGLLIWMLVLFVLFAVYLAALPAAIFGILISF